MYTLGVDLGTVYTAAATWEKGHTEIFPLGGRSAAIPSVVLLRDDGEFLVGETANRRALLEPLRVAREFKRRMGDATPILLGGTPHAPHELMARLLRKVLAEVAARQGEPPAAVCVCHPANWGPFKTDLLQQTVRMADVIVPVVFAVEPVAAAAYYARQQRVGTGALIGVYDLGGGTFDAAVVRKTGETSFEIVGQPEGIEHLGGADFDAAVMAYVRAVMSDEIAALDDESPAVLSAFARLREECTAAKETLSSDTDTSVPVLLPGVSTEVRLNRVELEQMIRPALLDTIAALQRTVRSAGVTAADLHSVLLVGGSSRIPLVAQLVGAELGRPVAVDAHPKHSIALGAALLAATDPRLAPMPVPEPEVEPQATPESEASPGPVHPLPPVHLEASAADPPEAVPTASAPAVSIPFAPAAPSAPAAGPLAPARPGLTRALTVAAAVVVVGGIGLAVFRPFGGGTATTTTTAPSVPSVPPVTPTVAAAASTVPSTSPSPSAALTNPLYACPTDAAAVRWTCLRSARRSGGTVVFTVSSNFAPSDDMDAQRSHLHVYLADPGPGGTTVPSDDTVQVGPNTGTWWNLYADATDRRLNQTELGGRKQRLNVGDYSLLCVRVANGLHGLEPDRRGGTTTGNCLPLP